MRNVYRIAYLKALGAQGSRRYLPPEGWTVHTVLGLQENGSKPADMHVVLRQLITQHEAKALEVEAA